MGPLTKGPPAAATAAFSSFQMRKFIKLGDFFFHKILLTFHLLSSSHLPQTHMRPHTFLRQSLGLKEPHSNSSSSLSHFSCLLAFLLTQQGHTGGQNSQRSGRNPGGRREVPRPQINRVGRYFSSCHSRTHKLTPKVNPVATDRHADPVSLCVYWAVMNRQSNNFKTLRRLVAAKFRHVSHSCDRSRFVNSPRRLICLRS